MPDGVLDKAGAPPLREGQSIDATKKRGDLQLIPNLS